MPFIKDKHNLTIWHYAAKFDRLEILKEISSKTHDHINDCDIYCKTPFFDATLKCYIDVFDFLNKIKEVDANIKDINGIYNSFLIKRHY